MAYDLGTCGREILSLVDVFASIFHLLAKIIIDQQDRERTAQYTNESIILQNIK